MKTFKQLLETLLSPAARVVQTGNPKAGEKRARDFEKIKNKLRDHDVATIKSYARQPLPPDEQHNMHLDNLRSRNAERILARGNKNLSAAEREGSAPSDTNDTGGETRAQRARRLEREAEDQQLPSQRASYITSAPRALTHDFEPAMPREWPLAGSTARATSKLSRLISQSKKNKDNINSGYLQRTAARHGVKGEYIPSMGGDDPEEDGQAWDMQRHLAGALEGRLASAKLASEIANKNKRKKK